MPGSACGSLAAILPLGKRSVHFAIFRRGSDFWQPEIRKWLCKIMVTHKFNWYHRSFFDGSRLINLIPCLATGIPFPKGLLSPSCPSARFSFTSAIFIVSIFDILHSADSQSHFHDAWKHLLYRRAMWKSQRSQVFFTGIGGFSPSVPGKQLFFMYLFFKKSYAAFPIPKAAYKARQ